MFTLDEAQDLIKKNGNKAFFPGEDEWAAVVRSDGKKDWVQLGDRLHRPGKSHVDGFGYPHWGDKLDTLEERHCIMFKAKGKNMKKLRFRRSSRIINIFPEEEYTDPEEVISVDDAVNLIDENYASLFPDEDPVDEDDAEALAKKEAKIQETKEIMELMNEEELIDLEKYLEKKVKEEPAPVGEVFDEDEKSEEDDSQTEPEDLAPSKPPGFVPVNPLIKF